MRKSIRQFREEQGMSQMELASALKVQAVSVYNWERGKHHPDARRLRAIADLFGVKMDDIALVGIDVDREGNPLAGDPA